MKSEHFRYNPKDVDELAQLFRERKVIDAKIDRLTKKMNLLERRHRDRANES